MKKIFNWVLAICLLAITLEAQSQETLRVLPKEIDDVLINPGIGFTTFQRFNGDTLNSGLRWTEGHPIDYQDFDGKLENKNHPMTSIAYFRVYWRYLEPKEGECNWGMIDNALKTARERNQTLMLRIAPYGSGSPETDVPSWYREMVGDKKEWEPIGRKWMVDPEDSRYAFYFGRVISELGKRYDGHPDLESMDLSIVGAWGEGSGSSLLSQKTRAALVNSYTDNFKKTPLTMLLTDEKTNKYGLSQADVGWRVDCLGDMGGFKNPTWSHMMDYYPQGIINFGMEDAWKKAPVSLEVCWVMQKWYDEGWDVDYIIDQSLKWHISSFNSKSSEVPEDWWPSVNRWLKKMGYRFVLRNFSCPTSVSSNGKVSFKSWWENKGVAPCYKDFSLAFRLKSGSREKIFITDADIGEWLPGDIIYDNAFSIPKDFPKGEYDLQVGIVDKLDKKPMINLAIEGRDNEGWYQLGKIKVVD
jgi:uncharacterized protein DUF4832/glycosyl hydrolase family 42 (putative beta-galactosidase)